METIVLPTFSRNSEGSLLFIFVTRTATKKKKSFFCDSMLYIHTYVDTLKTHLFKYMSSLMIHTCEIYDVKTFKKNKKLSVEIIYEFNNQVPMDALNLNFCKKELKWTYATFTFYCHVLWHRNLFYT